MGGVIERWSLRDVRRKCICSRMSVRADRRGTQYTDIQHQENGQHMCLPSQRGTPAETNAYE